MKVLVVAAHPDDEILGVGGTILKHISNRDDVFVCIVTKAFEPQWSKEYLESKIREQKEVDNFLGIKKRFNLDFPTTKLNTIPHGEINQRITDIVDEVCPDLLYTHFENDLNYDHTITFRGCMVAARPPKKIKLFCFETLSETQWNNSVFLPNLWIDIGDFIDKKIKAFQFYKSEVKPYPHPRSSEGIKVLARSRGLQVCLEYAEAFQLVRDVWS